MITKSRPAHDGPRVVLTEYGDGWPYTIWYPPYGEDTITYQAGPKWNRSSCNWKECVHSNHGSWSWGLPVAVIGSSPTNIRGYLRPYPFIDRSFPSSLLPYPDLSSVMDKIWEQIDLNCHDSVLLYSGIVQAVPLVGSAFRFVKIMNDLGRKLKKGMRHQPFTTVLKTAISADFINRFVVSPTIDDARKFLDAHNYVVRVMNTMYERNGVLPTAYSAEVRNTSTVKHSSYSYKEWLSSDSVTFEGELDIKCQSTSKLFLLGNVTYDTRAADPIKLWATRVGITRPLDSVWDLVPFSFVIDYFSRAGDFIAGLGDKLSDQDGLRGNLQRIVGCWASRKAQAIQTVNFSSYTPNIWWGYRLLPGSTPIGQFTYSRGQFDRFPVNPYSFTSTDPSGFLRLDLSSTRVRTLCELFVQGRMRKRRP